MYVKFRIGCIYGQKKAIQKPLYIQLSEQIKQDIKKMEPTKPGDMIPKNWSIKKI